MPKRGSKKLKVSVNKTVAAAKQAESGGKIFDSEKVEQEKKMFMWVGISCIMVVFFIAWIFNLKYQFSVNANKSDKNGFSWEQTKAELDKAMAQVKLGIEEIKKVQSSAQNTLPKDQELTPEQIDRLKGKLMSETGTSTIATSTKK